MSILPTVFVVLAALTPQEQTQFQSGLDAYWKGDYKAAVTVEVPPLPTRFVPNEITVYCFCIFSFFQKPFCFSS